MNSPDTRERLNYDNLLLMHKILTGKATARECRVDRGAMRFKSYIDGLIGTPIIETLVFTAQKIDKSILDAKTFRKKVQIIPKGENGEDQIYYYNGKIYSTEEIIMDELKLAKSIYDKKHPVIKEVGELLEYTTPMELTYGEYAFLSKLGFKISSVANCLNLLGYTYLNKGPFTTPVEHLIGVDASGNLTVVFKDGTVECYASKEHYCKAITHGEFYNV